MLYGDTKLEKVDRPEYTPKGFFFSTSFDEVKFDPSEASGNAALDFRTICKVCVMLHPEITDKFPDLADIDNLPLYLLVEHFINGAYYNLAFETAQLLDNGEFNQVLIKHPTPLTEADQIFDVMRAQIMAGLDKAYLIPYKQPAKEDE
ncbi:MAG: hypothetical protein K5981_02325 [Clostridia bacterium]|nr:hypothetical protein [Clostridia bacterium]